jgi:peptidoglycan/LPS O-acetylase OafA/YrhL
MGGGIVEAVRVTRPGARRAGSRWRYRPALDGVRAFAVAAVVLFHAGVAGLSGGFLGVDAFFVLSGFLITSLLLAEHAATGSIRLVAFWGRRARRLLPALLVVLVAVVAAGRSLAQDDVEVRLLRGDALAALGYVANWRMTYRGGDYFTDSANPSPLQHTWSLGIEEQFYLIWPLVVLALLGLAAWRLSRRLLLALCLVGAGASALAAAALYHPYDVDRAYYGTDTRAQALLIGAALAVLLARRPDPAHRAPAGTRPTARSVALPAAALAGVLATGWLWTHADGTDGWLYRGGLAAAALAVAAVIAHVMENPGSTTARVLSVAPIVWLGRISYGVYLWHWPLFAFLDAERTGLTGGLLLALRCAVLLAVSAASYVLVEQPVRTGRWRAWLPRPAPVSAALAGVLAVVLTGAVVVAGTGVARPREARSATVTLSPLPTPTGGRAAAAPIQRPHRRPGALPRIDVFGDSVAWTLGRYLPEHPKLQVNVRAMQGCGIARLPDIRQLGAPHTNYPGCTRWDERWRRGVVADDPDVAVILLDRWELMDRRLDGTYQHVGEPAYDAYLSAELSLAISIAGAQGARVVLLTAPYTHRAERPDGGLYGEDRPERVDAWNVLLRAQAAQHPGTTVLDLNAVVCPDGRYTSSIDGLRVRGDGLHFTPSGVQKLIAPWLLPRLWSIATTGSP